MEAGQILVKGTVSITDDSGQEVKTYDVRADGDIWAQTVYSYEEEIPIIRQVRVPTGRKRAAGF